MGEKTQSLDKSRLGRLLVNRGLIEEAQLQDALAYAHEANLRLGEYLISNGLITSIELDKTLTSQRLTRSYGALVALVLAPLQPLVAMGAQPVASFSPSMMSAEQQQVSILSQPRTLDRNVGDKVWIGVRASGQDLSYQWFKNGKPLRGATKRALWYGHVDESRAGWYRVRVTDRLGNRVWSRNAELRVFPGSADYKWLTPKKTRHLKIQQQPKSQLLPPGSTAVFEVQASGRQLSYQWLKNGRRLIGQVSYRLVLNSISRKDVARYQVRLVDADSRIRRSRVVHLNLDGSEALDDSEIIISHQPLTTQVYAGSSHTFSVSALGKDLRYQWRKDGQLIPNAVLPSLSLTAIKPQDAGRYDLVIQGKNSQLISAAATLTVAINRSVRLRWRPPEKRSNGDPLSGDEVVSYRLYHSTEKGEIEQIYQIEGYLTHYELRDLPSGRHYFAITAIDQNGYESEPSIMTMKTIHGPYS